MGEVVDVDSSEWDVARGAAGRARPLTVSFPVFSLHLTSPQERGTQELGLSLAHGTA